uniref:Caspase 10, apoptosis-related cysteine peptidase n=1 Tax=Poecilia reticulata TaxID=8081 RepID=A0A3P9NFZ7_POERE
MDFQKALLDVDKSLSTDEVEALSFLCTDILSRKPASLDCASSLFSLLMKEDHLSAGNPQLLVELLLTIQRPVILQNIKLSFQLPSPSTLISPYRKLLYRLSEQITEEELGEMKFLLKDVPRRKLEQKSTLGVFLELEHLDLINESSLEYLETLFKSVCPVLNEDIRLYRKVFTNIYFCSTLFSGEMASLDTVNPEKNNPESQENDEVCTFILPLPSKINAQVNRVLLNLEKVEIWLKYFPRFTILFPVLQSKMLLSLLPFCTSFHHSVLCDYPMTGKRGVCVIVDNFDFSKSYHKLNNREGSKFDRDALKEVFQWLGYEMYTYLDYNAAQIKSLFACIGQQDHSQYDSLVCCILSHGMEGKVYGVDGNLVEIKLLIECINGEKCPSLIEKPKMLFIQACQGCKQQYPVHPDGIEDETTRISADAKVVDVRSPVIADLLVGMSTVPDHVSFRDKLCGTWYIQSLCKNLVKYVPRSVMHVDICC